MHKVIPWGSIMAPIVLHCPMAEKGCLADAARADAAHPLHAAVVQVVVLDNRERALRPGVDARHSTRIEALGRDPEMKQDGKNAREWRSEMVAHVGSGHRGLVRALETTLPDNADINQLTKILQG